MSENVPAQKTALRFRVIADGFIWSYFSGLFLVRGLTTVEFPDSRAVVFRNVHVDRKDGRGWQRTEEFYLPNMSDGDRKSLQSSLAYVGDRGGQPDCLWTSIYERWLMNDGPGFVDAKVKNTR